VQTEIKYIRDHTIISFRGLIDYDSTEKFERDIKRLLSKDREESFLLDMNDLDFVGSSGIEKFMETIKRNFGATAKFIGLKKEFKRCFNVFSQNSNKFKYYATIEEALLDFNLELNDSSRIFNDSYKSVNC